MKTYEIFQNEIVEVVDFVCAHLPSTLMNDCIDFVDLYGDSIIDILVDQDLDPKLVCQTLALCKTSSFTGIVVITAKNVHQLKETGQIKTWETGPHKRSSGSVYHN